jgi:hypothetical protein
MSSPPPHPLLYQWPLGPVGPETHLHKITNVPVFYMALGLKGTVSRDFLLLVFFMNQFPPSP